MLKLMGAAQKYCDGLSRRSFLMAGGLAVGGLTLADLCRLQAGQIEKPKTKSVIMVYLSGGMSHQDTFDLKMQAPQEIRGEFTEIDTTVPGLRIGNLLPNLARMADRYNILRALVGQRDEHTSFQNLTGFPMDLSIREGRPNFGSIASRVLGPVDDVTPPFVDLFPTMQHRPYNAAGAGVLGPQHNQIKADGEDLASMKLRFMDQTRFESRRELLKHFDQIHRDLDARPVQEMDESYRKAFEVLTTSKLVDALDVSKEDPAVRDRYGKGSSKHQGDGAPLWNDQLLIARRLVEAGVRVVTVAYGFWDTHGNNFNHLKKNLPVFDMGISALIDDIYSRGLDQDVQIVVWDEFGRTPKINKDAGRDHWAPVNCALLSGGGMKTGQVIGSTDATGAYADQRPVHYQDVLATVYHHLGISTQDLVRDAAERPFRILPESAQVIRELY